MKRMMHVSGAVLPTVMIVSLLLLLTVLALGSLWEADFLFFSKHRFDAAQRANVESGFTLYREYPEEVMHALRADSTLLLYDSISNSRIKISRKPWGLYEIISVSGHGGKHHSSKILGRQVAYKDDIVFYYRNGNSVLTLAGKTNLKGYVKVPPRGIAYGQMGSAFFDGEKLDNIRIKESGELPRPEKEAVSVIGELRGLLEKRYDFLPEDSIKQGFYGEEPIVFLAGGRMEYLYLAGNIIVVGGEIEVDATCCIRDIVIVANNIRIKEGFKGSLQAFASDSLHVGNDVALEYPSGLYSEKYVGIGDNSEVNGYAIVNLQSEPEPRKANYEQSRLSVIRGLVYVSGVAQMQGIVSGVVFLNKAVYYSPRGYYENMIYDATMLENAEMAYPLWLEGPQKRKEAKWVY